MGQDELKVGLKATTETVVTKNNTAISMKSGDVEVFATPAMVALMEEAAVACVSSALPKDQTSVGTYLEVKHLAATPVGMKVKAEATLEQIDGKRLVFSVVAFDEKDKIGEGKHKRFIVSRSKFLEKVASKR